MTSILRMCAVLSFGAILMFETASVRADSARGTVAVVQQRMVKIFGAGGIRGLVAYSSGFVVSKEGHIVTLWNHVLDTGEVTVVLFDGRRFPARVLGAEPSLELAVLKIEAPQGELSLPHFDLKSSVATAGEGTRVLGFSNMFKVATGDEPLSVLHGVVAARTTLKARRGTFEVPYKGPVYIVDAITNNAGAEGGLLTTRDGRLLGMIGRELRNTETSTWINYSIPLTELRDPIEEIISGKFRSKSNPLDSESGPRRYVPADFGIVMIPDVVFRTPAFIDTVVPDSPAAKAGLRTDDLVVFVNDELMQSIRAIKDVIGRLEAGDMLRIVVRRGDELVTVEFPVPRKEPGATTPALR